MATGLTRPLRDATRMLLVRGAAVGVSETGEAHSNRVTEVSVSCIT